MTGLAYTDRAGELVTDERGATGIPGVFGAGDCANAREVEEAAA